MTKKLYYEKNFIHGFDLIEKYFRIELYFFAYRNHFNFLASYV